MHAAIQVESSQAAQPMNPEKRDNRVIDPKTTSLVQRFADQLNMATPIVGGLTEAIQRVDMDGIESHALRLAAHATAERAYLDTLSVGPEALGILAAYRRLVDGIANASGQVAHGARVEDLSAIAQRMVELGATQPLGQRVLAEIKGAENAATSSRYVSILDGARFPRVLASAEPGVTSADGPPMPTLDELLAKLDALIGLACVKAEVRRLSISTAWRDSALNGDAGDAGHATPRLRGQPGHRQDDRGAALGRSTPRSGCFATGTSLRRPAPIWSATTSGRPRSRRTRSSAGPWRCAFHRRGVLAHRGGVRQRLRPGGGRHAAQADGGPPRRGRRDRRGIPRGDGRVPRRRTRACGAGSRRPSGSPTTRMTNSSRSSGGSSLKVTTSAGPIWRTPSYSPSRKAGVDRASAMGASRGTYSRASSRDRPSGSQM